MSLDTAFLLTIISLLSYIIGAIPIGYLFARFVHGIDIRKAGSGNIGATNAARVLGGTHYFLLIFALDAGKAWLCMHLVKQVAAHALADPAIFIFVPALCLLVGNAYSCFIQFKGGKGVATTIGLLLAIAPGAVVGLFVASWLIVVLSFRWAALASIVAIIVTTIGYWCLPLAVVPGLSYFLIFLIFWLIMRHRDNMRMFKKK